MCGGSMENEMNEIRFENRGGAMKNFMGDRQVGEELGYRLGGGGGQYSSSSSSSCSSSPTAHHHHQPQLGSSSFPLPYYSSPPSSSYAYGRGVGPRAEQQEEGIEKEHMFDKVVTPSDVGKLNRLVIPKQHAEKYFPLDSSTNDKGLLLNFEDRNGKPWRFRYSYWNSSQSYVMTKGWSRFVKDKKLDAGDVVSFHRGMADSARDRLFIDWRRRPDAPSPLPPPFHHHFAHYPAAAWTQYPPPPPPPYYSPPPHLIHMSSRLGNPRPPNSLLYHHHQHVNTSGRPAGMGMVFESVPVVQGKAAAKRMRLFGVNISTDTPTPTEEAAILSSTAATDQSLGLFLSNPNPVAASNSIRRR